MGVGENNDEVAKGIKFNMLWNDMCTVSLTMIWDVISVRNRSFLIFIGCNMRAVRYIYEMMEIVLVLLSSVR